MPGAQKGVSLNPSRLFIELTKSLWSVKWRSQLGWQGPDGMKKEYGRLGVWVLFWEPVRALTNMLANKTCMTTNLVGGCYSEANETRVRREGHTHKGFNGQRRESWGCLLLPRSPPTSVYLQPGNRSRSTSWRGRSLAFLRWKKNKKKPDRLLECGNHGWEQDQRASSTSYRLYHLF